MKTIRHNATHGFAAVDAPLWLQQDMNLCGPRFPGVNALFFFSDDLTGIDTLANGRFPQHIADQRRREFTGMVQTAWNKTPDELELRVSPAFNMLGQIAGNGSQYCQSSRINRITGQLEDVHYTRTASTHATIALPPRNWTARVFTAAVTGLPYELCAEQPDVIPHRAIAAHELVHLKQYGEIGLKLDLRFAEMTADLGARKHCDHVGDIASGNYLYQWRLLSNFLSDLSPKSVAYWNSLFQHGLGDGATDECAAQLETKLIASCSEIKPPKNAEHFVHTAFDKGFYPSLHVCFNSGMGPSPVSLFRNLEKRHKRSNYRFKLGYELAERTLEAAHKLTPGVFTLKPAMACA